MIKMTMIMANYNNNNNRTEQTYSDHHELQGIDTMAVTQNLILTNYQM